MANRYEDWLRQAEADLRLAEVARDAGSHEWSCFAAQQGAEKAVKAVIQSHGGEAWGHSVTVLLSGLAEHLDVPAALSDAAKRLDKHYIPTRYPNAFDTGAPTDYYTGDEARRALEDARAIVEFSRDSLG